MFAVLLFGPTGSGKSTFAKRIAGAYNFPIYAIDEWMRELFWMDFSASNGSDPLQWALERCNRCENMIINLLKRDLSQGRGAVLDLGFSLASERRKWILKLKELGFRVHVECLDAPREVRWERVEKRNSMIAGDKQASMEGLVSDSALADSTLAITVDRKTFDWMEGYFQPVTLEEQREYANLVEKSEEITNFLKTKNDAMV